MRHHAAMAQIQIGELMAEIGERPHLNDKISELRKDLEFYNRVMEMTSAMLDNRWDWTVIEPSVMDETVEMRTQHYA